eukprot:1180393-Prorocentrum_minimum.AAC.1
MGPTPPPWTEAFLRPLLESPYSQLFAGEGGGFASSAPLGSLTVRSHAHISRVLIKRPPPRLGREGVAQATGVVYSTKGGKRSEP